MFSKIIDAFRTNNSIDGRTGSIPNINVERRSSTDEGDGNNNNNLSKSRTTGSIPITFNSTNTNITTTTATTSNRNTGAIGIQNTDTDGDALTADTVYIDGRRRSSLFGYSTNAADDYMQKDLLSSSWS